MKTVICGIYKITSPKGRVYIGQSKNCYHRINRYKNLHCKEQAKLYRSILKYGWDLHSFEILEECEQCELNNRETYYISLYKSFNTENGLNLTSGGGSFEMSKTTIEKLSKRMIGNKYTAGKKLSQEHKDKIRAGLVGKKKTKDSIEKRKASMSNYSHSAATREKISKSQVGRKIVFSDPKSRGEKISKALKGRIITQEQREKLSISARKRKRSPCSEETKRKISMSNMGRRVSEIGRKNMSTSKTGIKLPPFTEEHKRKISESRIRSNASKLLTQAK